MRAMVTSCSRGPVRVEALEYPSRRHVLGFSSLTGALFLPSWLPSFASAPPKPGDCIECIGVVNDSLNTCSLDSPSCVSTLNDDEAHFVAPWEWSEGNQKAAVERLVAVATGQADYEPGFQQGGVNGIAPLDAAAFVVQGVAAVVANQPDFYPERPRPKKATEAPRFKGRLVERSSTDTGSEYVYIVFDDEEDGNVIDMEFLFLPGDSLVNIRAASREQPKSQGRLGFSLTKGLVLDKNDAAKKAEDLRKALKWDNAPVITDFDVSFNQNVPTLMDRIFQAKPGFEPSGEAYPTNS